MRPEDVLAGLKRQPFVPLLIRLSNGREYTVRHPDLVFVGALVTQHWHARSGLAARRLRPL